MFTSEQLEKIFARIGLTYTPGIPCDFDTMVAVQLGFQYTVPYENLDIIPSSTLMSGIEVCDVESAGKAVEKIVSLGIDNVIITLGSRGAVIGNKDGYEFYPSVKGVRAVDPTAAGDSFVGAFCTAKCSGMERAEAMAFANRTAAITVTRMGAMPSLPTLSEVQNAEKETK